MKYADTALLVFAKAPVEGEVNTRLIPSIGAAAATRLQYQLIHQRLRALRESALCDVRLLCSPDTGHSCFIECRERYGVSLYRQTGADLGQRMSRAAQQAFEQANQVVLIGTDAPSLTEADIEMALQLLNAGHDCVITPAEDGGYVLIGLRQFHAALFEEISWGSKHVLAQTRAQAERLGLRCHLMASRWDIDREEDYRRYRAAARQG